MIKEWFFLAILKAFGGLKPLEAEYKFSTPLGDDTFVGVIDLICADSEGNIIIVDHKSHSKFSKKDLKSKLRQLYLYSKAIYERYGKFPTQLWFNHFKDNFIEIQLFHKEDYDEAIEWALSTIQKINESIEFEPNNKDSFICHCLCDYRNSCDYN